MELNYHVDVNYSFTFWQPIIQIYSYSVLGAYLEQEHQQYCSKQLILLFLLLILFLFLSELNFIQCNYTWKTPTPNLSM